MIGLTLGPLLFHWSPAKRRDFYFRIADEAPVDCVHLGEVVCSKREPFSAPDLPEIAERLQVAGKQVVLSTLALVTSQREIQAIRDHCDAGFLVEANDVSCLRALAGKPHVIGPLLNIFNEGSLAYAARCGAVRIVPPPEVTAAGIGVFAAHAGALEIEAIVFGRQTLSVSARCYHARSRGLHKDNCQFTCEGERIAGEHAGWPEHRRRQRHPDNVACLCRLLREMADLAAKGVHRFRLSPQDVDMVAVARLVRDVVDERIDADAAMARLPTIIGDVPTINGYMHGREGRALVAGAP